MARRIGRMTDHTPSDLTRLLGADLRSRPRSSLWGRFHSGKVSVARPRPHGAVLRSSRADHPYRGTAGVGGAGPAAGDNRPDPGITK
jgi:hypothetical protein